MGKLRVKEGKLLTKKSQFNQSNNQRQKLLIILVGALIQRLGGGWLYFSL